MPRNFVTLLTLTGALALSLFAAGCGGDDEGQFANQPTGDFEVEVIDASFERRQTVAETYDLVIAVRNAGDETIPGINATIDLPGRGSTLAFAYADKQPGLANNQRPIWVLEEGYPKLAGTQGRGGAQTDNKRTFEFGELKPGDTANMVWRVTAVRPGRYELGYQISAGLGLGTRAVNAAGEVPKGLLPVRISNFARLTEVNEKGEVVPVSPETQARVELQQEQASDPLVP